MAMSRLIFERIVGHRLPLHHVFLLQDLIFKGGVTIKDRYAGEHADGDEVREGASQQMDT